MTPAVKSIKNAAVYYKLHKYDHTPSNDQYGREAVEKLKISAERMFKTLVVEVNKTKLAMAVIPVSMLLDLKSAATAFNVKKVKLAEEKDAMRATGYVIGGISPIGQKKKLVTIIDVSALNHETIYVSAGRRGLDIELDPGDLKVLTNGIFAKIGKPVTTQRLCPLF